MHHAHLLWSIHGPMMYFVMLFYKFCFISFTEFTPSNCFGYKWGDLEIGKCKNGVMITKISFHHSACTYIARVSNISINTI